MPRKKIYTSELVTKADLHDFKAEVRGIVQEEVRKVVKEELGESVKEIKRWMKVYTENDSGEVREAFKDQASVLKDKDRELEGRIVILEERAGIAAPTPS